MSFDRTERFRPFFADCDSQAAYQIRFCQVEILPAITGPIVCSQTSYDVIADPVRGYVRRFRIENPDAAPYAVGEYDWDNREIRISYLPEGAPYFSGMENSFFHVAWESIVIREQRLLFHAALIDTGFGGILFSGPSGIGKSTQADLWCRFRNTQLINGDRPVLQKCEDGWLGWGAPYAGSSRCYRNASSPITAIVMLKQAPQCGIRRLRPAEAFRRVYAQLTLNNWDETCVSLAADLVTALVWDVPVFEFSCTPDEAAVEFLEKELEKVQP